MDQLYEQYYSKGKLQKRVVDDKNFTYRWIISILKRLPEAKTVLDIGCGVGTIDFYLSSEGKEVVGIDISVNAINLARKNAQALRLKKKPDFLLLDFPRKVPKKKFDLVICIETLEHIHEHKLAVNQIYNLLKKGGAAVISTPSKNAPLYRLGLLDEFDRKVGHLRRYELKELRDLFRDAGFRIVEQSKQEGLLRNFLFTFDIGSLALRVANRCETISDLLTAVDNFFLKIFGESNILLVVQRKL